MQVYQDPGGVRAVERALDILQAFRPGENRLSATDLLARVDLSRPTLYRLLRTLEARGFVLSSGQPQRFSLGPAVAQLAQAWSSGHDLTEAVRPIMEALWARTGETVALLRHQGQDRVCVAEFPSPQPLSFRRGVGHREQVLLGASGRAILAFVADPEPYLSRLPLHRRKTYREELAHIRTVGYALSREELIAGAVALAVPVFETGGRVAGSLAVYGPSVRIDQQQEQAIAAALLQASARIRESVGA